MQWTSESTYFAPSLLLKNHQKLTRDKQKTRREGLQANNSLSSESTGQKDQDSARGDGGTDLGRVADRGRTLLDDNVISRVVSALLALNLRSSGLVLEGEFLLKE